MALTFSDAFRVRSADGDLPKRRPILRLRSARFSLSILLVIAIFVVFGKVIAPQDPLAQGAAILQGPTLHHLLGTDYLGRDVLSRLLAGSRLSVLAAIEAVGVGLVLGVVPGVVAGFVGGWFDYAANRVCDALMTLPAIVFAIAVTGILGNGLVEAMLAIGILLAPGFFRVIRAATVQLGRSHYVEAAELLGASSWQLIRMHVVRKVAPTVVVTMATSAAAAMLTVSSLTFLGIGVQPPAPTWGGVLSADLNNLNQSPWAPLAPVLLIALTVAAFNGLVDAIRDSAALFTDSELITGTAPDLVNVPVDFEGELRDDDRRSVA